MYGCDGFVNGDRPTDEKVFVDVAFDRPLETSVYTHPTSRHIAAVENHGGRIVYEFHFNAVRAWIATSEIPALAKDPAVGSVLRVANIRRYDWPVSIGYVLPYTNKTGSERFAALGGRVDFQPNFGNYLSGLLPDISAGTLRKEANTQYLEGRPPAPNCDLY